MNDVKKMAKSVYVLKKNIHIKDLNLWMKFKVKNINWIEIINKFYRLNFYFASIILKPITWTDYSIESNSS